MFSGVSAAAMMALFGALAAACYGISHRYTQNCGIAGVVATPNYDARYVPGIIFEKG
jgi:hypothetical protein